MTPADPPAWENLLEAIRQGDTAGTRALLDGGADPNGGDPAGETALGLAIERGAEEIALLLLTRGADVTRGKEARANEVLSATIFAAVDGKMFDTARALLTQKVRLTNHGPRLVIEQAILKGAPIELLQALADAGARVAANSPNIAAGIRARLEQDPALVGWLRRTVGSDSLPGLGK